MKLLFVRSNIMISVAWIITFLLCIPQALVFHDDDGDFCVAYFPPEWGMKAYVTWFAFSNFFVPFIFLIFCYGRICQAIWDNFNSKTSGKVRRKLRTYLKFKPGFLKGRRFQIVRENVLCLNDKVLMNGNASLHNL